MLILKTLTGASATLQTSSRYTVCIHLKIPGDFLLELSHSQDFQKTSYNNNTSSAFYSLGLKSVQTNLQRANPVFCIEAGLQSNGDHGNTVQGFSALVAQFHSKKQEK